MAGSAWAPRLTADLPAAATTARHPTTVRVTHWVAALCFFALLVSGVEIVISHPRFYWGEDGNSLTEPLFQLPLPASRSSVPTGYDFVLPDQNGWSRSLHFQSAWVLVFSGLAYGIFGLWTGHFRKRLFPAASDLGWASLTNAVKNHLRFTAPRGADPWSYNVLQRLSYLAVVFVLFPLMLWTGLAMSPAVVSAFPAAMTVFGGQQSARTIHFFVTAALTAFLIVHVAMVYLAGFRSRTLAMMTGRADPEEESR